MTAPCYDVTARQRYESGLDNSPMYDGTFVNQTNGCSLDESGCGLMQLYDVGMTSMFVQEAFSLAELAQVIGRPQSLSGARAHATATSAPRVTRCAPRPPCEHLDF